MNRRKVIIPAAIAGVAAVAAIWWFAGPGDNDANRLTLYGTVELRAAQLAFNEQGRVSEVLVEEGAAVEPGQVLARLEHERLDSQVAEAKAMVAAQQEAVRRVTTGTRPQRIEQAEAETAAARARLKNAELRVRRLKETVQRGAATEQDLDNAVAERDVARAELEARRQALELAREGFRAEDIAEAEAVLKARRANVEYLEERLQDTALRAPAPGVIQSRIVEPGEIAGPARAAFVLARIGRKWVRAYLPEPALGRVERGMPAAVRSDSFEDEVFKGTVGFISPQAEFTPKNVQTEELRTRLVYEIRIRVDDPDNRLRLGMPVTVILDTGGAGAH